MTAETKTKVRQTKLAFKLRQVADKAEKEAGADLSMAGKLYQARRAAADLDLAAYSLGAKGERVKQLSAYFTCLRYYRELTGVEYAD